MPYAEGARYHFDGGCLEGTREEMIDKICKWVNRDDDHVPRMLLLSGVAGSGKSAIAHTVAHRFDQVGRLGSSFFFDRSHSVKVESQVQSSAVN
jgi:NB-ARC domain